MKLSDEQKVKNLIHTIGLHNFLSDAQIKEIVESQFEFTNEKLKEINIKINNSSSIDKAKEFAKVFYYKALCKIYICEYRLKSLLTRREFINKINNDRHKHS